MNYYITSDGELYHYGVIGMKWGVRRKLRKSSDFQDSKKAVKASHKKYWDSEADYDESVRKAASEFDKKRPYDPNATQSETLEWNIDRYVHVLNKSHSAKQKRDSSRDQYRKTLNEITDRYRDTLVGDLKMSDRQRKRIDRLIRDELVKDIWKDDKYEKDTVSYDKMRKEYDRVHNDRQK
jgi:hypothetical protein